MRAFGHLHGTIRGRSPSWIRSAAVSSAPAKFANSFNQRERRRADRCLWNKMLHSQVPNWHWPLNRRMDFQAAMRVSWAKSWAWVHPGKAPSLSHQSGLKRLAQGPKRLRISSPGTGEEMRRVELLGLHLGKADGNHH